MSFFPPACEFQSRGDLQQSVLPYVQIFLGTLFKLLIVVLETLSRIYLKQSNKQHTLTKQHRKLACPAASTAVSTVGLLAWNSGGRC